MTDMREKIRRIIEQDDRMRRAAPYLLRSLKEVIEVCWDQIDDGEGPVPDWAKRATAAIKKAEGNE